MNLVNNVAGTVEHVVLARMLLYIHSFRNLFFSFLLLLTIFELINFKFNYIFIYIIINDIIINHCL